MLYLDKVAITHHTHQVHMYSQVGLYENKSPTLPGFSALASRFALSWPQISIFNRLGQGGYLQRISCKCIQMT